MLDELLVRVLDKGIDFLLFFFFEEILNGGRMFYEFLRYIVFIIRMQSSEDIEVGLVYSDEDYEEDIIEFRILNEIIMVIDKISFWFSFILDISDVISFQFDEVQREGFFCFFLGFFYREEFMVKSSFFFSLERVVNFYLFREGFFS